MGTATRIRSFPSAAGLEVVTAACLVLAVWLAPSAMAEDVIGADAIIRQIKPRTRGIAVRESAPKLNRIALPAIQFDFDSDRLTPSALTQMRELSKALKSETLQSSSFSIQGHTDSTGTNAYNRRLSQRRARAVKRYLVDTAGIAAYRLVEVGLGEDYPLAGLQPTDDRNRRVEIVNLGNNRVATPRPEAGEPAPGRRALLIGIDAYQAVSPLNGPVNDASDMAEFLVEHAGFQQGDLRLLLDAEATRDNILTAIEEWLIRGTQSGDDVLLYFSGHGFQQPDIDGDETDNLDETLVPVDARVDEGRMVRGMITDDEIAALLDRLADRRTYVVVDACHSGTSTRGVSGGEIWRYTKTPRLPDGAPLRVAGTRGVSGTVQRIASVVQSAHANMVVWTAVRADQKALVDRDAVERPGSVFTRRLLAGAKDGKADQNRDGIVTMTELHQYLLSESASYCNRYPDDCRNGLTPQLQAAPGQLQDPAFERPNGSLPGSAVLAKDLLVRLAPDAGGTVRLNIRPGPRLAIGEVISIVVESDRNGYLTLLDIDAAGRLVQIFPNGPSLRAGVPASLTPGRAVTLPGQHVGFEFQATPPVGRGLLVAVVSEENDRLAALTSRHKDLSVAPSSEAYLVEIREALGPASGTGSAGWSIATLEYEVVSR